MWYFKQGYRVCGTLNSFNLIIRDIECVVPSADLSRLPADKLVYECVAAQNKYTAQVTIVTIVTIV